MAKRLHQSIALLRKQGGQGGQDRPILPVRVANHNTGFASSCPLVRGAIHVINRHLTLQMLISIVEKEIAKKSIKESDPFDWEKMPSDVSQATTTTSTPPMGQIYTTPPDNKPGPPNHHASDRVSPSVDMLEDHSAEHGNEANRKDSGLNNGNAIKKFGTADRGVIQKIREVLDAVEKDNGNFLKPQAVYLHKATKQVCRVQGVLS